MQEILLAGYSRSNSKFFTQRLNQSGKFVSGELSSFTWQATYDVVFHFQMNSDNFVVIHKKDGVVYLQKMHEDGTLNNSSSLKIELDDFCPNLQMQELYGEFYLLGQSESNHFFIKRILDQGKRYEDTYAKKWGNFYPVINVVKVGEEHLIYLQRETTFFSRKTTFYLQPINRNGKLEENTIKEGWENYYPNLNHFYIGKTCYLYGQHDNKSFFIRPILNRNQLGATNRVELTYFYKTLQHFQIGDKHFIYGQNYDYNHFFIRPVSTEGRLQEETFSQKKSHYYGSSGIAKFGDKTFYYGHTSENNHVFVLYPVTKEGKLGPRIIAGNGANDEWNRYYDFLFTIEGNFAYAEDWMSTLPDTATLKDICIPGTHDAGMYTSDSVLGKIRSGMYLTQDLSIKGQLERGARYFDLRLSPRKNNNQTDDLYVYHGDEGWKRSFGPTAIKVLDDVQSFIKKNPSETIILAFSHLDGLEDSSKQYPELFIDLIFDKLNGHLLLKPDLDQYLSKNPGGNNSLTALPLSEMRGKVIVCIEIEILRYSKLFNDKNIPLGTFDDIWENRNTVHTIKLARARELFTFSGYNTWAKNPANGEYPESWKVDQKKRDKYTSDLLIEDHYANSPDFSKVKLDQLAKYDNFGSNKVWDPDTKTSTPVDANWKSSPLRTDMNPYSLFSLDWTQTPQSTAGDIFSFSIKDEAKKANSKLFNPDNKVQEIFQLNPQGRKVNIISLDYLPAGIVELCKRISAL